MRTPSLFRAFVVATFAAFVLVSTLPIVQPLSAAVAHVQTIVASAGPGSATLTTGSITPTAGNTLIAVPTSCCDGAPADTVVSVKLDGTTDFTQDKTTAGSDQQLDLWRLSNVAGGAHTVTVTYGNATGYQSVTITEVSGLRNASPVDGAGATASGSSTTPSCGSYSATGTSFWVAAAIATATASFTAGSGWTIPTNGSDINNASVAIEYQANPGSSPLTGNFTTSNVTWRVVCTAYLVAATGPPLGSRALLGVGK